MNKAIAVVGAIIVIIIVAAGAYVLTNGGIYSLNGSKNSANQSASKTSQYSTVATTTVVQAINKNTTMKAFSINISYNATVGNYLVNATGFTLYLYTPDTPNSGNSTCYGSCATYWPPVSYTANSLVLPPTLSASNFNTITRTDGTKQLTYMGYPVYYYAGDKVAGSVKGQGIQKIWYVLNVPQLIIPPKSTNNTSNTVKQTSVATTSAATTTAATTTTSGGYGYP